MAILKVDDEVCIGCGTGKAYVKNQEGCSTCNCDEAIESCPVSAISWD